MKYLTSLIILFFGFNLSLNSQTTTKILNSLEIKGLKNYDSWDESNLTEGIDNLSVKYILQTIDGIDNVFLSFSFPPSSEDYQKAIIIDEVEMLELINILDEVYSNRNIKDFSYQLYDFFLSTYDFNLEFRNSVSTPDPGSPFALEEEEIADGARLYLYFQSQFINELTGELEIPFTDFEQRNNLWAPGYKASMVIGLNNNQFKKLYKFLNKLIFLDQ